MIDLMDENLCHSPSDFLVHVAIVFAAEAANPRQVHPDLRISDVGEATNPGKHAELPVSVAVAAVVLEGHLEVASVRVR